MPDPGQLRRPLYPPDHSKGPVPNGPDVEAVKRAVSRAGFWRWQDFDQAFSNGFAHGNHDNGPGVAGYQWKNGIEATGNYGEATHQKLRRAKIPAGLPHAGEDCFDTTAVKLYTSYAPPAGIPNLGYVVRGSKSVLDQDLTHYTSGFPNENSGSEMPAFDDGFGEGVMVYAPEALTVTHQSSSHPGDAFYADGASGLAWWFGHLDRSPANGTRIGKGKFIGRTCHNTIGGGPHVHVGVDGRALLGHDFEAHDNYTHGAPTIRQQLEAAQL
jgi:peptidoglycan hydrolase-like protein with peptidoglycan-binding domain